MQGVRVCDYEKAERKRGIKTHECWACKTEFECLSFNKVTGLCKCMQSLTVCGCEECGLKKAPFLLFYCSDECEYDPPDYESESGDEEWDVDEFWDFKFGRLKL